MKELTQRVAKALESYRPFLQQDGGDFEFLGIDDGIVKLRLVGHCGSCPHSTMTLKMGIERNLKEQVPEVKGVEQVF